MRILMVLTSHAKLGVTGRKTGFWMEELAAPYYTFLDAGAAVTLASPVGGQPPLDPASEAPAAQTDFTRRFHADAAAQAVLAHTQRLDAVAAKDFDALFYPGGHGPMWDLAEDPYSIALIENFAAADKPIAAVCHGPAALRRAMLHGKPLVAGRGVTGFSNTEEAANQLQTVVPFLLEDELKRLGGCYEKAADWQSLVVTDGQLVTGQNPASSLGAAKALLTLLAR